MLPQILRVKEDMMKRAFFPLVAFFWLYSFMNMAVAQAISVTPGEEVILTLKLVNVGDIDLRDVHVQLDAKATPAWIRSEARTQKKVDVPAKIAVEKRPNAVLPLIFTVAQQAPVNAEVSIRFLIRDGQGHVWTKIVPLKVLPRPKPKKSQLLANYPNPFNPETWIPYQLSKPAQVKIRIFDLSGKLVRSLDLGNRQAGFYTSRSEAAYWDGRNEAGERVASGLYFYHLQTDHFSAMRRMLIVK